MSRTSLRKEPETGSKAWFWRMRRAHWVLWVAPVFPLLDAVAVAYNGLVTYKTSSARQGGLLGHGSLRAEAYLDAALWEHLVLATPGVIMTATFGFVCYALWRIRINMGAGQKMFTAKDQKILEVSSGVLLLGVLAAVLAAVLLPLLLPSAAALSAPMIVTSGLVSTGFLSFSLVLVAFADVYRMARQDYEKLEDVA